MFRVEMKQMYEQYRIVTFTGHELSKNETCGAISWPTLKHLACS